MFPPGLDTSISSQRLLFLVLFHFVLFLIVAILRGVRWYRIMALIFISLMVREPEHLFMYLLTIYISSLEKCLPLSFACFFQWVLGFFVVES